MGRRIGIIAGSGILPFLMLEKVQKKGFACGVIGLRGETDPSLENEADEFQWVEGGAVSDIISFFKKNRMHEVLIAGKVDQRRILEKEKLNHSLLPLLQRIKEKTPTSVIKVMIDFFNQEGIHIVDPSPFLSSYLCQEGVMTEIKPSLELEDDINLGMRMAKRIADLDLGQTVVIKEGAILAVEAMEGTDETIRRGGQLAGKGFLVVKAGRSSQDMKIDLPGVGLRTVEILVKAGGKALCIEAQKVLFFQKEKAISLANGNKVLIMAKEYRDT